MGARVMAALVERVVGGVATSVQQVGSAAPDSSCIQRHTVHKLLDWCGTQGWRRTQMWRTPDKSHAEATDSRDLSLCL